MSPERNDRFQRALPMLPIALLLGLGLALLVRECSRPRPAPPRTIAELTALLSKATPPLFVIERFEGQPENGVWICAAPRPREQVEGLFRLSQAKFAQRWQGVVYCERATTRGGTFAEIEEEQLQGWGEHGMRIGPFLLFGDPVVLQRVRKALSET